MNPQTPDNPPGPDRHGPGPAKALRWLDRWMAANPWHPRATPFFIYMLAILAGGLITDGAFGLPELTALKPAVYTVQIGLVVFLLWRYRKLVPELNLKFHWLAVPTGIGLLFAWVYLGYATIWMSRALQGIPVVETIAAFLVDPKLPMNPDEAAALMDKGQAQPNWILDGRSSYGDAWYWTTMTLRLLGMSLVVPLFEELWVRSAVLRGVFSPGKTKLAMIQLASDLPIVGDAIAHSAIGRRAAQEPAYFTRQLIETRVGQVSYFAIIVSTLVFMLAHQRRDYLGCIACGVVWCGLVWWTNKPKKGEAWSEQPAGGRYGIGPIAWSHGITNAALWAWTLYTNDWQYL